MRGNAILITEDPRGRFKEGVVDGTPKPGSIMQLLAGTSVDDNGHHTWGVYDRSADGDNPAGPLAVLLEKGEGVAPFTITGSSGSRTRTNDGGSAFEAGDLCRLYCPLPGDELNVLWATSGTSTGDALTVGQIGMPEDGTGLIIDTTGVECEPVIAMEALSDTVAAGTLTWVMFAGQ
jgi:hypothetical protein